jgi:hypothetical protein
VSGPQVVADATYRDLATLRAFVDAWERDHRGATTPLGRLVGFCLAVRRRAFEEVGGFDEGFGTGGYEDDDLCRRLAGRGWGLLVADGSYVHHHGHATFDANGLDWRAIELRNQERFDAKHGRAPTLAPASVASVAVPRLEELGSVVVLADAEDAALEAALVDAGLVVRWLAHVDGDAYVAVEGVEPRADLVVVVGAARAWPGVELLDVPVLAWGDPVLPGTVLAPADVEVPGSRAPSTWVPDALATVATGDGFGASLLACRRLLDAGDVVGAIDAVARAENERPGTAQAANAMAVCAHNLGQRDEALAFLRRALAVAPGFAPARDNLRALGG